MFRINPSCVRAAATGALFLFQTACGDIRAGGDLPPPRLPTAKQASSQVTFLPGDSLELWVEEDASFNGTFEVREGGYVLVPKIGRVVVLNLTRDAAEKRIRETLQSQQLKQATVFVEHRPNPAKSVGQLAPGVPRISVFLTGAVSRPGQHAVPLAADGHVPGVFETLLMAGGMAKFGDESKVKIMRLAEGGRRQPMVVDVRQIRDGIAPDVPVGDGDIIQVPEKVFGF
ncbi:MAG: polysaccharide biosynthesis/export family protein [Verrucomicrobiaceae bacterium]